MVAVDSRLSASAWAILRRRYLRKDDTGHVVESPDQMIERVAKVVAEPDRRYGADDAAVAETCRRFRDRMTALEFLPNSPTLMNAGRPGGQLAACFVVPVEDSMPAIFDAVKWAAEIQTTGGGTGFSFSRIRPSGDRVASTGGVASGPLAFMDVFDAATDAVKQGGTRRGANMAVLRIDHPDVLDLIGAKLDPSRLTNFNVSLAITDAFMRAVQGGTDYALVNPRSGEEVRRLDACKVLRTVSTAAWRTGDPGVLFIDRINADHPVPAAGTIEATNPCAEQPLLPFESCVLGSINLSRFVHGGTLDRARLIECIHDGVHFLDNVIDANHYPLAQIEAVTSANRKIGLGVMGLADLFIQLGIAYDSDQALEVAAEIAELVEVESLAESERLAEVRGSFRGFATSLWPERGRQALRNATTTTVAPTGTISILAGCSSGIEPLYAVSMVRRVLEGERLAEVHPLFHQMATERGIWNEELAEQIAEQGRVRGLAGVPEDLQRLFPTAYDVTPEHHVRMQATFQRHSHSAVSKTVNLPERATVEHVERIYLLAYQLGCKGVTVYRDGSRAGQVLSFGARAQDLDADGHLCPECQSRTVGDGACSVCPSCGWSRCAVP